MEIHDKQNDDEEYSAKVIFSLLNTQIWNLIEIMWKDNLSKSRKFLNSTDVDVIIPLQRTY